MSFSVDQEVFQGPLALLLELIDERKLEITQVSLADVADAFLTHLQTADVPEEEMAEFLLVAARLIYLKSRALLPYLFPDEEEAADRLEDRLRAYKDFVEAAKRLQTLWGKRVLFLRKFARMPRVETFRSATNVTPVALHESFVALVRRLAPFFALREQRMTRTLSVEERVRALREALEARAKMTFHDLSRDAFAREEVVVNFLALLEMLRRREITIAQETSFGGIVIERI